MVDNRSNLDRGRATVKRLRFYQYIGQYDFLRDFIPILKISGTVYLASIGGISTIMRVFISLCLGFFIFTVPACMSNGTSDGQALEVHLDNPSVCDGLVWLGTFSSAPSDPLNDDAYYNSTEGESFVVS